MVVNGDRIKMFSTRNPAETPWGELGVDLVLECTGKFTSKEKAMIHIQQGAKKVLISAPGEKDVDATIVYGVNQNVLKPSDVVVSNASCTTNCLAPLVKPLLEKIGIESGLMTTIHAFTNDQVLTDVYHKEMRRARSAVSSMIPTKTGAAKAVGLVLPALAGRFDGFWEYNLNPWDIAAGYLIIEEAGGRISNFNGDAYNIYDKQTLATNGQIHEQMLEIIKGTGSPKI
jgi:glyceraldehyde 3-phosphate dehydrogenase